MLKKRILTVLVLVPPLLAAFFLLSPEGVAAVLGLFIAAAAWEWSGLCRWPLPARIGYAAAVTGAGVLLLAAGQTNAAIAHGVFAVASAWWLLMPLLLRAREGGVFHSAVGRAAAGLLILVPAWMALGLLHAADPQRPFLLLFVIALVAAADTGAYAAGHAFGRTKLAPSISPGKTVEGVAGGILAVVLLAYICGTMIWNLHGAPLGAWMLLAAVAGLISVLGDLAESKMKRVAGVKDSGRLLPGHGGVFDRIDALTAASPVFALGWLVLFNART